MANVTALCERNHGFVTFAQNSSNSRQIFDNDYYFLCPANYS